MSKIDEMLKNEKVEWKKLGEVCDIGTGKSNRQDENENGQYPFYVRSKNILKSNTFQFDETAIIIPGEGGIGEIFHYVEGKYALHQRAYRIKVIDDRVLPKFLYYYMTASFKHYISSKMVGTTSTSIRKPMLMNFEIPIPSLKVQEKIAKTLDKFTNYVTELQSELQLRTSQYNYYRDLLLSEEYLNKLCEDINKFGGVLQSNGFVELRRLKLSDVGKFTRGNGLQKKDFRDKGRPVIHYGQIYTSYDFYTDKTLSFVDEEVYKKLRKAKTGDILMATTSENIEDVGKVVLWLGEEEIGFSGDMYTYSTTENPKYIAYYFKTNAFHRQKERKVTGTKLIRIHSDDMEKFEILLPPIWLQEKVVEILDKFTELLSETSGLLPAEIEQRQKQYEYYREKLLTFEEYCGTRQDKTRQDKTRQDKTSLSTSYFVLLKEAADKVGVEFKFKLKIKELKEVARYSKERISADCLDNGNYVGVDNLLKNKLGKENSKYVPERGNFTRFKKDAILIGNIRPYLRKIWYADSAGGTNGDVLVVHINESYSELLIPRFLYHVLADEKFFDYNIKNSKGSKMPRGDKNKIMQYKIPLPPLPVQEHIVSILDNFDTLVNDIKEGLPKEIELREKEYIYYRDKLLSFK